MCFSLDSVFFSHGENALSHGFNQKFLTQAEQASLNSNDFLKSELTPDGN